MNEQQLEEIRRRERKSFPGPWKLQPMIRRGDDSCTIYAHVPEQGSPVIARYIDRANAEFIANARQDVPALIQEIEERDALIHDLQIDSSLAIRIARQQEVAEILQWVQLQRHQYADDLLRADVGSFDRAVSTLATKCLDEVIVYLLSRSSLQGEKPLLPPDRIREENDRLRKSLRSILDLIQQDHTETVLLMGIEQYVKEALNAQS